MTQQQEHAKRELKTALSQALGLYANGDNYNAYWAFQDVTKYILQATEAGLKPWQIDEITKEAILPE